MNRKFKIIHLGTVERCDGFAVLAGWGFDAFSPNGEITPWHRLPPTKLADGEQFLGWSADELTAILSRNE